MKLLIVTTNADSLGPGHATGTWLEEYAVPYDAFQEAGAAIVVASPKGGATPIDPQTTPNEEQRLSWAQPIAALQNTQRLADVKADDFDAVFIPGGHGPLIDLAMNAEVLRLLADFDRAGKIIGAVCHGPAALLNAKRADGTALVAGKRVTAFTNNEEKLVKLDRVVPFLLETALRDRGACFDGTPLPFIPHVVRDGNLITGQNPASSSGVAERMLEALRSPAK
jgi:putative intracellular protease/amidase